jgi:hypothetical protein
MQTYFKPHPRRKGVPRGFKNRFREKLPRPTTRSLRPADDFVHDSGDEMAYAMHLEERQRRGEIKLIEKQVRFELRVNGLRVCNHYPDFRITLADGRVEIHEYKGVWSNEFLFKSRLLRATYLREHPEVKYRLIVRAKGRFTEITWMSPGTDTAR